MEVEEIKRHLKMAFWDVNYSVDTLYDILTKKIENEGSMSKDRIYQRLLETFSWYKILEIVPRAQINEALEEKIVNKIWYKGIKERYKNAGRILREITLSSSR